MQPLALFVVLMVASCHKDALFEQKSKFTAIPYEELFFRQKLDHFSYKDDRTFQQRYFVVDHYWNGKGPIILSIGGESEQNSPDGIGDYIEGLAREFKAKVLTLEHRFFGKSLPFDKEDVFTVEHLHYLTVDQAIFDLGNFLQGYISRMLKNNITREKPKVLAIGGSYSGMLSSNIRFEFPSLIDVAWSSSGVVEAILDFKDFDLSLAEAAGHVCAELNRAVTQELEKLIEDPSTNEATKERFGMKGMTDDDFFWVLSDAQTLPIQYGRRYELCDPLEKAFNDDTDLIDAFATFCKEVFYPKYCGEAGPYLYSDEEMLRVAYNSSSKKRAWWWMVCHELSWAQSYPGQVGIRSKYVSLASHERKCNTVYGKGIWPPDVSKFNGYYGGYKVNATRVVFLHSSQDPWQWAGVRQTLDAERVAYVMVGPEAGHCSDLKSPVTTDPFSVKEGRRRATAFVRKYLV